MKAGRQHGKRSNIQPYNRSLTKTGDHRVPLAGAQPHKMAHSYTLTTHLGLIRAGNGIVLGLIS